MPQNTYNASLLEEIIAAPAIAGCVLLSPLLRPWYGRWGASDAEIKQQLPGDDMVPNPVLAQNLALTIQATPSRIWPWLVQMGQGRGGLYSYERLENMAGSKLRNADCIIPELQTLQAGDSIRLDQRQPALPVYIVEPERHLVFLANTGTSDDGGGRSPAASADYYRMIWGFHLLPVDGASTRPLARTLWDYKPTRTNILIWRVMTDPISFVMQRQMLFGIKRRAEANT